MHVLCLCTGLRENISIQRSGSSRDPRSVAVTSITISKAKIVIIKCAGLQKRHYDHVKKTPILICTACQCVLDLYFQRRERLMTAVSISRNVKARMLETEMLATSTISRFQNMFFLQSFNTLPYNLGANAKCVLRLALVTTCCHDPSKGRDPLKNFLASAASNENLKENR